MFTETLLRRIYGVEYTTGSTSSNVPQHFSISDVFFLKIQRSKELWLKVAFGMTKRTSISQQWIESPSLGGGGLLREFSVKFVEVDKTSDS